MTHVHSVQCTHRYIIWLYELVSHAYIHMYIYKSQVIWSQNKESQTILMCIMLKCCSLISWGFHTIMIRHSIASIQCQLFSEWSEMRRYLAIVKSKCVPPLFAVKENHIASYATDRHHSTYLERAFVKWDMYLWANELALYLFTILFFSIQSKIDFCHDQNKVTSRRKKEANWIDN